MNAYLDLHVLQSIPPSNINRDDTGSPKTATFGGFQRARVSSQAWKRSCRIDFNLKLETQQRGIRSKRLVPQIAERVATLDPSLDDQAEKLAIAALKTLGIAAEKPKRAKADDGSNESVAETQYLIFLSNQQIDNLAELIVQSETSTEKLTKKSIAAAVSIDHSIDIALFGRMVADVTDLKVDAAAQVAHAISVHEVSNEFDYFTAIDDHPSGDHAGAGMIGTVEFNSSTLYRYATLNLSALAENLGDADALETAVQVFIDSFVRSMPTGKQNSFAHRTLPHAVVATLRTDQPINWVQAFEVPARASGDSSRLAVAARALADHAQLTEAAFGSGSSPKTWVVSASRDTDSLLELGTKVNLEELITQASDGARSHAAPA